MEPVARLAAALSDRYAIERELGAGGMATVYLAQDLKHDRRVAIKVLRPELAAVIGAERFLAEIKTTANLQHPHILPLFDSGAADSFLFYAMPFVQGETLRDRLEREKQLPIADAVRIAGEVASALDYAHRQGVIHRDIKPENVLLHDGRALVADFGIALAASSAGSRMTETGMSLGTPAYMSPEQAMGERALDARTDIYALGAVLYEMLTGDPPFIGSTAQAIVAKVMTEKPAPPSRLRDTVPEAVEDAVLTALAKLPADRFGSAAEFATALTGETTGSRRYSRGRPVARSAAGRWAWPAVALAAMALGAWGWLRPAPRRLAQPPTRLAVSLPRFGGSGTWLQRQLALTPDGGTLIYSAIAPDGENRTMRLDLSDTASRVVPGVIPFLANYSISPDGREIIGQQYTGSRHYRYPLIGGNPQVLPEELPSTNSVVWTPDGATWFSASKDRGRGIARLDRDGTVTNPFGTRHSELKLLQVLPDGHTVVATQQPIGTPSGPVALLDLESGEATTLLDEAITEARYTAGYLVVARPNGSLEAFPFDPARKRLLGSGVQIAAGISIPGTGVAQFAVADNGTVAYAQEDARSLVLVTRDGSVRLATTERQNFHNPQFSPDGRRLAVDFVGAEGRDVWVLDLGSGTLARATFAGDGHDATWTPDGTALTYVTALEGMLTLFRVRPGQAESTDSLMTSEVLGYTGIWLPDGSGMVTVGNGLAGASGGDIALNRNAGHGPIEPLVATRFEEQAPDVSPDGRWLAFTSAQSGRNEIYVRALDGSGDQVQVSTDGGIEAVWNPRGGELFYRAGPGVGSDLVAATISVTPRINVTSRTPLFPVSSYATATPHRNYDVLPDGRTFAFVQFNQSSKVVFIQNLPALVARLSGRATNR